MSLKMPQKTKPVSVRKFRDFVIKQKPCLTKFMILSLFLHIVGAYANYIIPEEEIESTGEKPVKVRFIPPSEKNVETRALIGTPNPEKFKPQKTEKLTSNSKNHEHSAQSKNKKQDRNFKTLIPKQSGELAVAQKTAAPILSSESKSLLKRAKKIVQKKKRPILRQTKKAKVQPQKKEKTEETSGAKRPNQPIGLMAMLNSLDTDKYASLDSSQMEDEDEPISLNTKETKYSDYFARIKFQIEQVWTYPLEVARRGISGQITLKFKLSRQGNLVGVRLVNSSGTQKLDEAALQAVKKAAPYYPFPPNINKEKITILATFIYSPSYRDNIYSYP